MKKLTLTLLLAAATVAAQTRPAGPPPPTPPPEPPPLVSVAGGSWSVVGALTAPMNANIVEGGLGWPGLHVSYLRGISNQLELGARFTFNYGVEGLVGAIVPGVKFQFLLRFKFFDNGKISLALRFEPGPLFYFYPSSGVTTCSFDAFGNVVCGRAGSTVGGLTIPVGMRLGLVASSAVNVGVSFDLPMWFSFGRTTTFLVPILMGAGVEYFLQSNLLLAFNIKMGPTLSSGGGTAVFTFESKLGVGYRF